MPNNRSKHRIRYALSIADHSPDRAVALLRSAQRGNVNTPTLTKLNHFIKTTEINYLAAETEKAFQHYHRQFGINIPAQSRRNLAELKDRVNKLYSANELSRFRKCWYKKIVKDLRLKHVTRDLNSIIRDGKLKSLWERQKSRQTTNNSHTRGNNARTMFTYFTLGLDGHKTPEYWSDKLQEIHVALTKAPSHLIRGLWIGSHQSPQYIEGELPGKYFGETRRAVSYQAEGADDSKKTTQYNYPDGTSKTVSILRKQEIYCAYDRLSDLLDALLYQTLEEIAYIGGKYHTALATAADPTKLLRDAYHHLFIPDVYPEAKIPVQLALDTQYVNFYRENHINQVFAKQFFQALSRQELVTASQLLFEHPEVAITLHQTATSVYSLVNNFKWQCPEDHFNLMWNLLVGLVRNGANLALAPSYLPSLLMVALAQKHPNALRFISLIIDGIEDIAQPLIRHSIDLSGRQHIQTTLSLEQPVLRALLTNNVKAFELLVTNGARIPTTTPLVVAAYLGKLTTLIPNLVNRYGVDINARFKDETILMVAAQKDDGVFIQDFCQRYPHIAINAVRADGCSALHIAAASGSPNAVRALLAAGIDPALVNQEGETAFSLANSSSRATTAQTRGLGFFDFASYSRSSSIEGSTVVQVLKELGADHPPPEKTLEQRCKNKKIAAATLVYRRLPDNTDIEILLVRKKDLSGNPCGNWMFPGGLKDLVDKTLVMTAKRECYEETGIEIEPNSLYCYEKAIGETFYRIAIYFCEVPHSEDSPKINDDIADAAWIPLSELQTSQKPSEYVLYACNGIAVEPSNALLIDAHLQQKPLPIAKIDERITKQHTLLRDLTEAFTADDQDLFTRLVQQECYDLSQTRFFGCAILDKKYHWFNTLLSLGVSYDLPIELPSGTYIEKLLPLVILILNQRFDLAKQLIQLGADINRLEGRYSALGAAATSAVTPQGFEFLQWLLSTQRVRFNEDLGLFALYQATVTGNLNVFKLILSHDRYQDIDINRSFSFRTTKMTLLRAAVDSSSLQMTCYLLEQGAFVIADNDVDLLAAIECRISQHIMGLTPPELVGKNSPQDVTMDMRNNYNHYHYATNPIRLGMIRQLLLKYCPAANTELKRSQKIISYRPLILKRQQGQDRFILFVRDENPFGEAYGAYRLPKQDDLTEETSNNNLRLFSSTNSSKPNLADLVNLTECYYFALYDSDITTEIAYQYTDVTDGIDLATTVYSPLKANQLKYTWINVSDVLRITDVVVDQCDAIVCSHVMATPATTPDDTVMVQPLYYKLFATQRLQLAYNNRDQAEFAALVKAGANVNAVFPQTAFMFPASLLAFDIVFNNCEWVDFLKSQGADLNYQKGPTSILYWVVVYSKWEFAAKLVTHGARTDLLLNDRLLSDHLAASEEYAAAVAALPAFSL